MINSGQPVKWVNPCIFLRDEFNIQKRERTPLSNTINEDMLKVKEHLKAKYRLIYELGTRVGLRVSEIIAIKPSDLIRSVDVNAVIISDLKNGADKDIRQMPADLSQKLFKYIDKKGIHAYERIFPITKQAIWAVFKSKGVTPSELRRYHASTKESGMRLYIEPISGFLEHASVEITARYIRK